MGRDQTDQDATLCGAHDAAASAAHGQASASGRPPRFTGRPGTHASSELRQAQEEAVCSGPSTSSGSPPGFPGPAPGLLPAVLLSIFTLRESLALSPLQKVRHGKGYPLPKACRWMVSRGDVSKRRDDPTPAAGGQVRGQA